MNLLNKETEICRTMSKVIGKNPTGLQIKDFTEAELQRFERLTGSKIDRLRGWPSLEVPRMARESIAVSYVAEGSLYVAAVAATVAGGVAAVKLAVGPTAAELVFTRTTAAHMVEKFRYVPRELLATAIRFGNKVPDPRGAKNAFRYTVQMFRNGKQYELEVVAREIRSGVYQILHFCYK